MAQIRVVLAEDNALLREGVAKLIDSRPGLELVGAAQDLPTLLALVDEVEPDVVVTDIRMPPTSTDEGIRAANDIRTRRPETGVVVLSQYAEPSYALALLASRRSTWSWARRGAGTGARCDARRGAQRRAR